MTERHVLVVEDEVNIRDLVCLHLGLEGLECEGVGDGREALRLATTKPYDLIVLDLMIPGLEGVAVCRGVRRGAVNRDVPILMLTARREESDKIVGLESGADDYLTKPFGIRELVARARALLRRRRASAAPAAEPPVVLQVHGLRVDPARRQASCGDQRIDLTAYEFDLLRVLASHPGIVFSREALLVRVWSGEAFVTERSVDSLVKRLRRKIERDSTRPELILTVRGAGYKMADV